MYWEAIPDSRIRCLSTAKVRSESNEMGELKRVVHRLFRTLTYWVLGPLLSPPPKSARLDVKGHTPVNDGEDGAPHPASGWKPAAAAVILVRSRGAFKHPISYTIH